jgi:putative sugar O-methyltransferase
MHPCGPADDDALLAEVQREVDVLRRHGLTSDADHRVTGKWSSLARQGLATLVAADGRLNPEVLRNFRRDQILVHDLPSADVCGRPMRNRVVGWRRGTRHCLLECLDILRRHGYEDLLRKYPCAPAGNPHRFDHAGYSYTFRWARHVYFLGLLKRILDARLGDGLVALDIGCSYGIFSSLVKQEYPRSHHVLVDLPEQLILARYFLGCSFPDARLAGPENVLGVATVTRAFLERYDFTLMPAPLFHRLAPEAVDLVTNFASFGEMSRQYFDTYVRSAVFQSSRYLFTVNRVAAVPERYGNDITILDYPIWDPGKRLHFDICSLYSVDYLFAARAALWYRVARPDPHFEYLGRVRTE